MPDTMWKNGDLGERNAQKKEKKFCLAPDFVSKPLMPKGGGSGGSQPGWVGLQSRTPPLYSELWLGWVVKKQFSKKISPFSLYMVLEQLCIGHSQWPNG